MVPNARQEPVFNAPTVVAILIGLLIVTHTVLALMPREMAEQWLVQLAFIPARYMDGGAVLPGGEASRYISPLSHMILHGDWIHLGFNCAWLLAFGAIVARRMNALRFLAFTILSGLVGALVFWLVNPQLPIPMVGASGAVSGLMGGVFRFLFNAPRYGGFHVLRETPRAVPAMPLSQALQTPGVLFAVGIWLGLNLVFATDLARLFTDGDIAWEAHVGGFIAGFLLLGVFDEPLVQPPADADFQLN